MQSQRVSNQILGLRNMVLGHLEHLNFLEAKGGDGHGKEEEQGGGDDISDHF